MVKHKLLEILESLEKLAEEVVPMMGTYPTPVVDPRAVKLKDKVESDEGSSKEKELD